MSREPKEPQSYGSTEDWVTGKTGQQVNDPKAVPPAEHRDFYDSSQEAQPVANQGGLVSDQQLGESAEPVGPVSSASDSSTKVNTHEGGAKRDSYFKKRDYE